MAKLYHSRSAPTRTDRGRVKREFFRDLGYGLWIIVA
jgi:hypothetical protein